VRRKTHGRRWKSYQIANLRAKTRR